MPGRCAVDSRLSCALVLPDPFPRHREERRVHHEVEQITEPATRIGHRPMVQFRLNLQYPPARPGTGSSRCADVHRRIFWHDSPSAARLAAALRPCDRLSRPPTTTAAPPRSRPVSRRRTQPHSLAGCRPARENRHGSRVHLLPIDGSGAQLYPGGLPRVRRSSSARAARSRWLRAGRAPAPQLTDTHRNAGPDPPGFEPAPPNEAFKHWFLAYTFSSRSPDLDCLAVPAHPGFVRAASHPPRHLPGQAALSFTRPLRRSGDEGLAPPFGRSSASRRTLRIRWMMQVCTVVSGHTLPTTSGRPLRPSQTRKNTSRGPRPADVGEHAHPKLGAIPGAGPQPKDVLLPVQGDTDGGVDRPVRDLPVPDLHHDRWGHLPRSGGR